MARVVFTDTNGNPAFVDSFRVLAGTENPPAVRRLGQAITSEGVTTTLYLDTFEQPITVRGEVEEVVEKLDDAEVEYEFEICPVDDIDLDDCK